MIRINAVHSHGRRLSTAQLAAGAPDGDWQSSAARQCAPEDRWELFYSHRDKDQAKAREWCGKCPFTDPCLNLAFEHDEKFGVWGGVLMSAPAEVNAARRRTLAVAA